MKMVFEQFGFNKEVYGDASLVMEIATRFLRVMETLNEKDEFYLTVSDFSDAISAISLLAGHELTNPSFHIWYCTSSETFI